MPKARQTPTWVNLKTLNEVPGFDPVFLEKRVIKGGKVVGGTSISGEEYALLTQNALYRRKRAARQPKQPPVWVNLDTLNEVPGFDPATLSKTKENEAGDIIEGTLNDIAYKLLTRSALKYRMRRAKQTPTWVNLDTLCEVPGFDLAFLESSVIQDGTVVGGTSISGEKYALLTKDALRLRRWMAKQPLVWVNRDTLEEMPGFDPATLSKTKINEAGDIIEGTLNDTTYKLLARRALRQHRWEAKQPPVWVNLDTLEEMPGFDPATLSKTKRNEAGDIIEGTLNDIAYKLLTRHAYDLRKRRWAARQAKQPPVWANLDTLEEVPGFDPATLSKTKRNEAGDIIEGTLNDVAYKLLTRNALKHRRLVAKQAPVWVNLDTLEEMPGFDPAFLEKRVIKGGKVVSGTISGEKYALLSQNALYKRRQANKQARAVTAEAYVIGTQFAATRVAAPSAASQAVWRPVCGLGEAPSAKKRPRCP